MKLLARFKKLKTLYKILIIVGIIVVGVGGWITYDNRPRPLGDEMVYLGKESYGCWTGLCDARPNAVLYYETNLSSSEIGNYFEATSVKLEGLAFDHTKLITGNESFFLTYEQVNKFPTTKKYIVSLLDSDYNTARKSLK